MRFLAELRRRNVLRMAGLYLVGAWLIVQVAETLLPAFDIPNWVLRAVILLLALGFVPALVFSWVFELTPEGLKRDAEVPAEQSIASATGKRMDRLLLLGMFAVIAAIAADRWWPRDVKEGSESTFAEQSRPPTSASTAKVDSDPAPATPDLVRGIAVLPFSNLSPDPDNAFFAGGVYEEVLTKLARIADLRVISRTSMERIAEERLEVSAIGKRLGVSHVLEGSVRRAGDQVRVTVQLIEAQTDAHVWAENYDRGLDDVFAIQSEIAIAIADQLKISLSPQLQTDLGERPTQDQMAYELYLRALEERRAWRDTAGFRAIIELLEPAVARDPQFVAAQVLLSEAYGRLHWLRADPDGAFRDRAHKLVVGLEQRWPERAQTQLARAQWSYNIERDYARALEQFRALQPSLPGDPGRLSFVAACLKRLNRHDEFLAAARVALASDPESPALHLEVLQGLTHTQRYEEALQFGAQARQKYPTDIAIDSQFAYVALLARQDVDAMLDYGRRAEADGPGKTLGAHRVVAARFMRGDIDGALRVLEQRDWVTPRAAAWGAAQRAELLRLSGRVDDAKRLADDAYAVALATTDSETPRADLGVAFWYATAAQIAGQAGARENALRWQAEALAVPSISIEDDFIVALALAAAQRGLGDAEAAWTLMAPYAGSGRQLPNAELRALRAYYDRLYGASPSYQAYMQGIESKP